MALPDYAMNAASFPRLYEHVLVGSLFRPWVDDLLDRVGLKAGDSVLDVACGTGIVARVARQRLGPSARIVGVDVSAPMLLVARETGPDIEWREGNAMWLPVPDDEKFDVVLCQQGLQFVSDKLAAAREMRRVLTPGGRVAVSTWLGLEQNPIFLELHEVAVRQIGHIDDTRFSFGDGEVLRKVLQDGGLRDVSVVQLRKTLRVPDAEAFLRLNSMALMGMSKVSSQLSENGRAHLLTLMQRESAPILARYRDNGGIVFEMGTNVASAKL